MITHALGRTDLQVSSLGLGTAPIGGQYQPIPESQAVATIHAALERGITLFDTAPLYGAGRAELVLGAALAGVPRERYLLSTKVGRLVLPNGSVVFDMSRDGILRSLEASLQRLQLDQIDIALLHDPDDFKPAALEIVLPLLSDLRAQGVVRAIGSGMNQWQMLAEFVRAADLDCLLLAGRYTLLEQGALPLLALCQQRGVGVLLGGVYNSGILATGPIPGAKYNYEDAPEPIRERTRQLAVICARHGVPLRIAATQFAAAHPAVTALIFGAVTPDEVAANVAARETPIPPALWAELRAADLVSTDAPLPA